MSSNMKDARWQITLELCDRLGIDWDSLDHPKQGRLLYSAQQFLDLASAEAIKAEADKFNNPTKEEVA